MSFKQKKKFNIDAEANATANNKNSNDLYVKHMTSKQKQKNSKNPFELSVDKSNLNFLIKAFANVFKNIRTAQIDTEAESHATIKNLVNNQITVTLQKEATNITDEVRNITNSLVYTLAHAMNSGFEIGMTEAKKYELKVKAKAKADISNKNNNNVNIVIDDKEKFKDFEDQIIFDGKNGGSLLPMLIKIKYCLCVVCIMYNKNDSDYADTKYFDNEDLVGKHFVDLEGRPLRCVDDNQFQYYDFDDKVWYNVDSNGPTYKWEMKEEHMKYKVYINYSYLTYRNEKRVRSSVTFRLLHTDNDVVYSNNDTLHVYNDGSWKNGNEWNQYNIHDQEDENEEKNKKLEFLFYDLDHKTIIMDFNLKALRFCNEETIKCFKDFYNENQNSVDESTFYKHLYLVINDRRLYSPLSVDSSEWILDEYIRHDCGTPDPINWLDETGNIYEKCLNTKTKPYLKFHGDGPEKIDNGGFKQINDSVTCVSLQNINADITIKRLGQEVVNVCDSNIVYLKEKILEDSTITDPTLAEICSKPYFYPQFKYLDFCRLDVLHLCIKFDINSLLVQNFGLRFKVLNDENMPVKLYKCLCVPWSIDCSTNEVKLSFDMYKSLENMIKRKFGDVDANDIITNDSNTFDLNGCTIKDLIVDDIVVCEDGQPIEFDEDYKKICYEDCKSYNDEEMYNHQYNVNKHAKVIFSCGRVFAIVENNEYLNTNLDTYGLFPTYYWDYDEDFDEQDGYDNFRSLTTDYIHPFGFIAYYDGEWLYRKTDTDMVPNGDVEWYNILDGTSEGIIDNNSIKLFKLTDCSDDSNNTFERRTRCNSKGKCEFYFVDENNDEVMDNKRIPTIHLVKDDEDNYYIRESCFDKVKFYKYDNGFMPVDMTDNDICKMYGLFLEYVVKSEHYGTEKQKCVDNKYYKPCKAVFEDEPPKYDCCAYTTCFDYDNYSYSYTETSSYGNSNDDETIVPSGDTDVTKYNKCAWVDGQICYVFNVFNKNGIEHDRDEDTLDDKNEPFAVWLVNLDGDKIVKYVHNVDKAKEIYGQDTECEYVYKLYGSESCGVSYDPVTCVMTFDNQETRKLYKDEFGNFCVKITRVINAPQYGDNITFDTKTCTMYDGDVVIPRTEWTYGLDEDNEWCTLLTPCCLLKEGAEGVIGFYDMTCEEYAELPENSVFIDCDIYNICCKPKCLRLPNWDLLKLPKQQNNI